MWNTLIIEPMVNALLWIYSLVGNFGIAIILFTILIRLITHPLTASQVKSTAKMGELQKSKKWQEMQKKYKDDKNKLAQEQMALYKELGINPMGSCLPMLIQFPIIIGLYQSGNPRHGSIAYPALRSLQIDLPVHQCIGFDPVERANSCG